MGLDLPAELEVHERRDTILEIRARAICPPCHTANQESN